MLEKKILCLTSKKMSKTFGYFAQSLKNIYLSFQARTSSPIKKRLKGSSQKHLIKQGSSTQGEPS